MKAIYLFFFLALFISFESLSSKVITKNQVLLPDVPGVTNCCYGKAFDFNADIIALGNGNEYAQGKGIIIFEREQSEWKETAFLEPNDAQGYASFGNEVKVMGSFVVVTSEIDNGAVYVFKKINGVWSQTQKITPQNPIVNEIFATSIDVTNNKLFVGTRHQSTVEVPDRGVYVYHLNGQQWIETGKLKPSEVASNNLYAYNVKAHDNKILINDSYTDNVHLFTYSLQSNEWVESQIFSNTWRSFGDSLAINNQHLLIGSPEKRLNTLGDGVISAYKYDAGSYVFTEYIYPNDHQEGDDFATNIALEGDHFVATRAKYLYVRLEGFYHFQFENGGWNEKSFHSSPTDFPENTYYFGFEVGIHGNQVLTTATGIDTGTVYMYQINNGSLGNPEYFRPDYGAYELFFGNTFAVHNGHLMVEDFTLDNDGYPFSVSSYREISSHDNQIVDYVDMSWGGVNYFNGGFNYQYALNENTAVISAPLRAWYNGQHYSGLVKIFEKTNGEWLEGETLIPTLYEEETKRFGSSVILVDEYIFVADSYEILQSSSTGSVYIFKKENNIWEEKQKIVSSDRSGFFGQNLFYDDNQLFVSASDAVYVFENILGNWQESQKIVPLNIASGMNFGSSVTGNGSQLFIGAEGDFNLFEGAVYSYVKIGNQWVEQQKILHPVINEFNKFGQSVAIDNDQLFISAPLKKDVNENRIGDVSLFRFNNNTWEFEQNITESNLANADWFGYKIVVDNSQLYISAPYTGQQGENSGSIFVYDIKDDLIYKNSFE